MSPSPAGRLADLVARDTAGETIRVVPFWSHRPEKDGSTGRGSFSQWWPSPVTVDGETWPSAEHWMMAASGASGSPRTTRTSPGPRAGAG